jgi:hypothetical protein
VVRGGSWNNNQNNARAAYRNDNNPDNRNNNIGFRVVGVVHSPPFLLWPWTAWRKLRGAGGPTGFNRRGFRQCLPMVSWQTEAKQRRSSGPSGRTLETRRRADTARPAN